MLVFFWFVICLCFFILHLQSLFSVYIIASLPTIQSLLFHRWSIQSPKCSGWISRVENMTIQILHKANCEYILYKKVFHLNFVDEFYFPFLFGCTLHIHARRILETWCSELVWVKTIFELLFCSFFLFHSNDCLLSFLVTERKRIPEQMQF